MTSVGTSLAGALTFVVFGLVPIALQLVAVFGVGGRARSLAAKLHRHYSAPQFQVNWGMFTNNRETGFVTVSQWAVRLRRDGVVVEERALGDDISLVKFLERQRFDDREVAASVMGFLLDYIGDVEHEFDRFELVRLWKERPPMPPGLFARFAHQEFVARAYSSEVVASCRVGA